ncbi:MAG: tetratricopeptide repeat protein [Spirulina sp. SIO3F2]|nr:tetratricopeptide repeat protein [Spirulina sp. SIO3F2]
MLGADALLPLVLGQAERSQQDKFLGYLQWTREAMQAFKQPIVLWVTSRLLREVGRKAPDFWSWRKDVFRFQAPPRSGVLQPQGIELLPQCEAPTEEDDDELPIEELLKLVEEREQQENAQDDPILATLYYRLGNVYKRQASSISKTKYKESIKQAIFWLNKAAHFYQKRRIVDIIFAKTLSKLARLHFLIGQYSEAESFLLKRIKIGIMLFGEHHLEVAKSINNLGLIYKTQGRYLEAEQAYFESLEIRKAIVGEEHPDIAESLNNLAKLYYTQEEYSKAEPLLLEAIKIWKNTLEEEHDIIALSINNLAKNYCAQGKYSQSESLFKEALRIRQTSLGEMHPDTATILNGIANLYYLQEKFDDAESLFFRTLTIREHALGNLHPDVATTLNDLANLYQSQRQYHKAESSYLQSLEIREKVLGKKHPETQITKMGFQQCIKKVYQAGLAHTLSDHPLTKSLLQQIRDNEI